MRKAHLVLVMALVAGGAILLWAHSIKRPYQVTFSDGYLISGDGTGPYVAIAENLFQGGGALIVGSENSRPIRSFSVGFGNAMWLDRGFIEISPVLPSADYYLRMMVGFYGHSWSEVMARGIGEHFEPELLIELHSLVDYEYMESLYRYPLPTAPTPLPLNLLNEGHAYLVREGEDVWALDVDAWFITSSGFQGRTYYVRLYFRMTIDFRPMII